MLDFALSSMPRCSRYAPPLTAKLGYANLATAKMKLTSATTVGRCSRTASREAPGSRVYWRVQNDGLMPADAPGLSFSRTAMLMSGCGCPAEGDMHQLIDTMTASARAPIDLPLGHSPLGVLVSHLKISEGHSNGCMELTIIVNKSVGRTGLICCKV